MTAAGRAPYEPLTPAAFHVLLALSSGPLHGYGVMRRVETDSGIEMGPGTVYGTINRLESLGWVESAGTDPSDPRRGRLFDLSAAGREALEAEAARIDRLAGLAREHRLLPQDRR